MTVHATAPSLSLFPQRSPISDPALAQALPRKQTDRDLGLIQPTAVLGGVVRQNRSHSQLPASSPKRSTIALRVCELRLSSTKWMMVSASG